MAQIGQRLSVDMTEVRATLDEVQRISARLAWPHGERFRNAVAERLEAKTAFEFHQAGAEFTLTAFASADLLDLMRDYEVRAGGQP